MENSMKKLIKIFMFLFVFSTVPLTATYANTCEDKADACYTKCDVRWKGDTWWDGAGRAFCKSGCAVAEAGCIIKEWVK